MTINLPHGHGLSGPLSFIRPGELRGDPGVMTFRKGGIRNMEYESDQGLEPPGLGSVAFRAEAIKLLHARFAEPAIDLTSPASGKIDNTLHDGRTFRFTLRLQF